MKGSLFILPILLLIVAASGCTTQPETGNLVLKITDAPNLNIEEALVTISNVQVHIPSESNESGWVTVVEGPVEYDLVELIGVEQVLGETELPAGIYTQIRLEVESALVTIDGVQHDLTIPSGSVKLVRAFEIRAGETTELILDFNAQDSIHQAGSSYLMRPAIRILGPSPGDGRDGDGQDDEPECVEDSDCGEGQLCVEGECEEAEEPECVEDSDCGEGYISVEGECEESEEEDNVTGNFVLMVSDAPADIGDFDSLIVSFSMARVFHAGDDSGSGWEDLDLSDSSVDLTQVVGEMAVEVLNVPLPEGTYSKIEMHVEEVDGVVNGSSVEVFVPSGNLKIVRQFEITEGETTKFVFDINVVRKGQSDEYNLLPVIGKSGVVGKDIDEDDVDEAECTVDEDCDEGQVCTNGECEEAEEPECTEDADCSEGYICTDGVCTEVVPECVEDTDCSEGQVCTEGECDEPEDPVCYSPSEAGMLLSDAFLVAGESDCMLNGTLEDTYQCNEVTGTWWIDLDPFEEMPGCSPACVVDIYAQEAEINWRCTGA